MEALDFGRRIGAREDISPNSSRGRGTLPPQAGGGVLPQFPNYRPSPTRLRIDDKPADMSLDQLHPFADTPTSLLILGVFDVRTNDEGAGW